MKPFEIIADTDQIPFASSLEQAAQGKLTEAQDFFDDADDRFNGGFAQANDRLAEVGLELISHLLLRRSLI